jgi:hypothetical protein
MLVHMFDAKKLFKKKIREKTNANKEFSFEIVLEIDEQLTCAAPVKQLSTIAMHFYCQCLNVTIRVLEICDQHETLARK